MNIIEARELLGVHEDASMKEIYAANEVVIERALKSADLALYRRSTRAVAELLVASKRFTREQADWLIEEQDAYVTRIGQLLDQNLAKQRQTNISTKRPAQDASRQKKRDARAQKLTRFFSFFKRK